MSYLYKWGSPISFINTQNFSKPALSKLFTEKISEIACGQNHFFLLTQDNNIFGYGLNNKGQLGTEQKHYGVEEFDIRPQIMTKSHIKHISCGWNHTLLLDDAVQVFSCGQGAYVALVYGRGANSGQFKPVTFGCNNPLLQAKITQISAGRDHSLAISQTKVYGWGNSRDNQLGLVKQKIYFEPQELYIYHSYLCFAGDRCSYFGTDKGLYAVGYNEGGKLGIGNEKKVKMPKRINFDQRILKIQDGGYIMIETTDHEFYLSGRGTLGQFYYPTKIKQFKQYHMTSIGKQFGIIRNTDNQIETWNFENHPNPTHNEFLSSLSLQKVVCGPKFIIGFSNSPNNSIPDRQNMIKSTVSNTLNSNGMKYNKRRRSGDLNINLNPKYIHQKHDLAINGHNYDYNNSEENLQLLNNVAYGNTKRSELNNSIEQNYWENCSQESEPIYESERDDRQIQTPIFIRRKQPKFDELQFINDSQDNCHPTRQIIEDEESFEISYSNQNYTNSHTRNRLPENQLREQVQYLQILNKSKDEEISSIRKQMNILLQIVESNMTIKNIVQAEHPSYSRILQSTEPNFKKDHTEQPTLPTNMDSFHENIVKLKDLLHHSYGQ